MASGTKRRKLVSNVRNTGIKGAGRIAEWLSRALLPAPKGPVMIETNEGGLLLVDPTTDRGVEHSLYWFGIYERGTLEVLKGLLKPGDAFVDVGANIGLMTVLAATWVGEGGRVFAFEPHPNTRKLLEGNIATNGLTNVTVYGVGLASEPGVHNLHEPEGGNRGMATFVGSNGVDAGRSIEVATFDACFDPTVPIAVIKIDVEGFELEVLRGAMTYLTNRQPSPALIIEFSEMRDNTFGSNTQPLYAFLKTLGQYRLFKSVRGKERSGGIIEIRGIDDLPKHDNVYALTEAHLVQLR